MRRILMLAVTAGLVSGTKTAPVHRDADDFYKSDAVGKENVSFDKQYKMKVEGNLFLLKPMKEGEPKEVYIVRSTGHADLYDRTSLIPFGKLEMFFISI